MNITGLDHLGIQSPIVEGSPSIYGSGNIMEEQVERLSESEDHKFCYDIVSPIGDCINQFKTVTITTDVLMLKVEILTGFYPRRRTKSWEKKWLLGEGVGSSPRDEALY